MELLASLSAHKLVVRRAHWYAGKLPVSAHVTQVFLMYLLRAHLGPAVQILHCVLDSA